MTAKGQEFTMFSTERRSVTTVSGEPAITLRPVDKTLMWVESPDGKKLYKIEHAGAWDAPDDDESDERRSGCYYEDEQLPQGAISLYRVTEVVGMKKSALGRFKRWLNAR